MTKEASRFVGSIPEHYDAGLGPHIFEGFAEDLSRRVAALMPGSVVELAAGTGIVTRRLRHALPETCDLLASDLNQPMLDFARAKFDEGERVGFEVADATDLPWEDERFDVVTCQFGVMFFPDKPRSYAEARRVLRSGGHYLFNVWDAWPFNAFAEITHEVVAGFFPEDPPGFYRVPFGYHEVEVIRRSLLDAGFRAVSAETVPLTAAIPSADLFARGLVFGNPLFQEIEQRGGDADAIRAAVSHAIATRLGGEMQIRAIIVHAEN
ncbi:MAG: methyltransferase domain-containing protein [Pseudomonadales bacterium]|nr:class I SAM-dependent methyltransferase [Pseudomonadales bacterium]NIX06808.1 methyltransferase domain-containing protein [Pseudomonadales bacterium]